jgi:hypothetical protein
MIATVYLFCINSLLCNELAVLFSALLYVAFDGIIVKYEVYKIFIQGCYQFKKCAVHVLQIIQ